MPPEVSAGLHAAPWGDWQIMAILCIYIVGFFATAGAAGTDIASNSRSVEDVHSAESRESSCPPCWPVSWPC